jgi:heavy metal sensor kinase
MTISFRTRLTAIAALVVAGVLAATLATMWSGVRSVEIDRLDSRLCLEARRLASQPFGGDDMRRLEADVMAKLRLADASQLMLRIERNGAPAHQSANWRADLAADRLAWTSLPDQKADAPPSVRPEASPPGPRGDEPRPRRPATRLDCSLASFDGGTSSWRVARIVDPAGSGFVAADSAAAADELLAAVRGTLRLVVPLALGLVVLGAWLVAAVSLRPVARLRDAMKAVSQKDLSQRLASRGEDREFRELIAAYNAMLARLQASFEQASRFSADAAHELRTPLTILQGRLEQAIRKSERRAIQADLADMQEEIGRLAGITRKLLLLSQADAGRLALHRTRVDLRDLLAPLVADAQMLASDRKVTGTLEPGLTVNGDEILLRQTLNNLVSNAIRYCKPGGRIDIAARRRGPDVEVTFVNAAEPIPAEARDRIFDRFYRLDAARNRESEGTGLGLSLAREIARAHGGDLTLEPGAADEFGLRLRLPAA